MVSSHLLLLLRLSLSRRSWLSLASPALLRLSLVDIARTGRRKWGSWGLCGHRPVKGLVASSSCCVVLLAVPPAPGGEAEVEEVSLPHCTVGAVTVTVTGQKGRGVCVTWWVWTFGGGRCTDYTSACSASKCLLHPFKKNTVFYFQTSCLTVRLI